MKHYKLIIIGSGPAGYTAAIYSSRAELSPLILEGAFSFIPGGQLMTTTDVENFPGFPEGIKGPDLVSAMRKQAERFGSHLKQEDVLSVNLHSRPFFVTTKKNKYSCDALIIATGANAKRLYVPGTHDDEFWQKGVTACAVCDGASPIFRNKPVIVLGGGDSALEEALFLTKYATQVFIVHRRNTFSASKVMISRVLGHPKITVIWDSVLKQVKGDSLVRSVILENVVTKIEEEMSVAGVFFAIGHVPNTEFLNNQIQLDGNKYIITEAGSSKTSLEGVFAAGDVQDKHYRQAITAAASGCQAAIDAERWLSTHFPG